MRLTNLWSRPAKGQALLPSRVGRWVEAALLLLLAIVVAQLVWAVITPTGPFGAWRARQPVILSPQARAKLFSAFDPFYRVGAQGGPGAAQVTSLPLQLYGTRINEGSGQGSAIIADSEGEQASYAVGAEIAPGVTLKAVYYDHVVIDRAGISEMLYIDQSGAIPQTVSGSGGDGSDGAGGMLSTKVPEQTGRQGPPSPEAIVTGIDFAPRIESGHVTGIVVSPRDGSDAFSKAGFHAGDIIVQINGRDVSTASDINNFHTLVHPGARLSLMVERGAATVPIALILPDNT